MQNIEKTITNLKSNLIRNIAIKDYNINPFFQFSSYEDIGKRNIIFSSEVKLQFK